MSKSFATLKADVLSELQDVNSAVWDLSPNTSEIEKKLEDAFREVSDHQPYIVMYRFEIESRTGTATSTTANKLVDSAGQFLSTDVGKVIYNTTDHTWATVSAYDSANTLSLTGNIMVSGENYEMYNEGCRSNKEIYIGDVTDYIGGNHGVIDDAYRAPEYPIGTRRNVDVNGDVLTLLMDGDPEDSADADANVDVFIWFKVKHRVSQLTTLTGELTAGYAAGVTSINIDGLQASGTFAEGTLFTIENCRGTYRVTADVAFTSNATISFFPALEDAVLNNADVTITGSTLNSRFERLVVQLASARAILSKTMALLSEGHNAIAVLATINATIGNMSSRITQAITDVESARTAVGLAPTIILEANAAIDNMTARITQALTDITSGRTSAALAPAVILEANTAIGAMSARITQAINDLSSGRTEIVKTVALIDTANTALGKVDAEVNQAIFDLHNGRAGIAEINIVGNLAGNYANYASADIQNARTRLEEAVGYIRQASADESVGNSYGALAIRELNAAVNSLNQASGYLRQVSEDISVANVYGGLATRELTASSEYLRQANGFLSQARADESVAGTYGAVGARELNMANSYLAQAGGYIQKLSAGLRIAQTSKLYREEGQSRLALVLGELEKGHKVAIRQTYSRL